MLQDLPGPFLEDDFAAGFDMPSDLKDTDVGFGEPGEEAGGGGAEAMHTEDAQDVMAMFMDGGRKSIHKKPKKKSKKKHKKSKKKQKKHKKHKKTKRKAKSTRK